MKKSILSISIAVMAAMCMLASCKDDSSDSGKSRTKADFTSVQGTYDELFTVLNRDEYHQKWVDAVTAAVGEDENLDAKVSYLKNACAGTVYGEEAVAKYAAAGDGSYQFDCFFINGVSKITFDGSRISAVDEKSAKVFDHEYYEAGDFSISGMMDGKLYETDDADAGEFKYFFMLPDTPAETYHIEFRYGSDRTALSKYNEGPYAYWLAAGIPENADDAMITNVINLFCAESFSEEE